MVSLKKYFSCKCGANSSFEFNSDMSVEEITISARCPSCSANIHVSVSALLSPPGTPAPPMAISLETPAAQAVSEMEKNQNDKETRENVEQAVRDLFKY
jgi:transcription elongation factor Elf1